MGLYENALAVVSENSEDYLTVMRMDGKVNFACSSVEFARETMGELQETIAEWEKIANARDMKHHHGNRPHRPEAQAEKGDGDKPGGDGN